MGSESKTNGGSTASNGGGGFKSKVVDAMYSGEKKHVFAGIAVISVIFGIPWYLMNRGDHSIGRIKITWTRLIGLGRQDFRLVRLLPDLRIKDSRTISRLLPSSRQSLFVYQSPSGFSKP
ncbi:hypothetical protein LINPERPRIM_LOCUS19084 [Linum perenne]